MLGQQRVDRRCLAPDESMASCYIGVPGILTESASGEGRATKRAVSNDFGRELFTVEQNVGAKDRQRGHSPETPREKRALHSEALTGRAWPKDRTTLVAK